MTKRHADTETLDDLIRQRKQVVELDRQLNNTLDVCVKQAAEIKRLKKALQEVVRYAQDNGYGVGDIHARYFRIAYPALMEKTDGYY